MFLKNYINVLLYMDNKYSLSYAMSSDDINKIVNTNVIEYNVLYNIQDIDDVIINGSCVILYKTSDYFGHWCCITTYKNKICFFDPYGYLIDSEIKKFIDNDFGHKYYKGKRLVELLYNSKYKNIEYNDAPLQAMTPGINTCGRHCCSKIIFKNVPLQKYIDMCNNKNLSTNPDNFVLKLTNLML